MSTTERIVFLAGRPEFLYDEDCTVIETYCFGDDVGSAAYVECEAEFEASMRTDDRVIAVEENREISIHVEPEAVSEAPDDVATIEDVRRLHDVPADGATGKGGTVVGMDSGIDTTHPVFDGASIRQVDVTGSGEGDAVGHGTAVLGQVTQLAPEAELIALRIFGAEGSTETNVIMRAYEWLHANVGAYDVVNMSWGSSARSAEIDRVHNGLVEKGVRDVVSAGNCIPANTWVLTGRGWRRMSNVYRMGGSTTVVSYNRTTGEFEKDTITETYKREMTDEETLYRVKTDEGHVLELTGEHPVLTSDGYSRADEIDMGDEIITRPDTPHGKKVPDFYDDRTNPSEKGIDNRETVPSGEEHVQYKQRIEVQCPECGETRELVPYKAENQIGFCSATCITDYYDLKPPKLSSVEAREHSPDDLPEIGTKALAEWRAKNPEMVEELAEHPQFKQEQGDPSKLPHDYEVARAGWEAMMKSFEEGMWEREPTDIETKLYELIDGLDITYEREYPIYVEEGRGGVYCLIDVAIPERKIAVFADGNYWHNYPDGTERDEEVTATLESRGWTVIRFWGSDLRQETSSVKRELATELVNGATVTNIERIEPKKVYDIGVEKNHNFVANGLVVHNSGDPAGSPATAKRAFGVAACTEDGKIADFSSYNPDRDNPDVAAIGVNNRLAQASGTTMGTDLPGPWVKASGTSFSAPEVSGMVAKYLTVRSETPPGQIKADFEETARDIPDQPRDGAGLVDYAAAVGESGLSPPSTPRPRTTNAVVQDLVAHDVIYLEADWLDAGEYRVTERESDENVVVSFERLSKNGDTAGDDEGGGSRR